MKNNNYKKNGFGKYALDFKDKKTLIKASNRKVRYANKKECKAAI